MKMSRSKMSHLKSWRSVPRAILSGDPPRGPALVAVLAVIVLGLGLAPVLFPGTGALNVAAKICYFVVLAASYDLLLGYTGIVSFAHTMFFGIGGYGAGLALFSLGPSWTAILIGTAAALVVAVALALAIGLFSLRVRALFFAMITLAVASAFSVLASQMSALTGGEDGRTFRLPAELRPSFHLAAGPFHISGRVIAYYLVFVVALIVFLVAAAGRQLAVRPRAAGDPRERVPRRGARLSHHGLSLDRQLPRGGRRGDGGRALARSGCATPDRR